MDRGDVGVVQRREELRFALKPCDAVRVAREFVWQDLDRDLAPELRVARAVDLAHAARPERGDDFIRPEASPAYERHGLLVDMFSPRRRGPRLRSP